jgi:hypothetical protein
VQFKIFEEKEIKEKIKLKIKKNKIIFILIYNKKFLILNK